MSKENTTVEETSATEETTTEAAIEEVAPEPEPTPDPTPEIKVDPASADDKSSDISGSIGTGKQVFSGACRICGARIASGVVNTEGKVNCPTCKGDF